MKITKRQLKQIIKEELQQILREQEEDTEDFDFSGEADYVSDGPWSMEQSVEDPRYPAGNPEGYGRFGGYPTRDPRATDPGSHPYQSVEGYPESLPPPIAPGYPRNYPPVVGGPRATGVLPHRAPGDPPPSLSSRYPEEAAREPSPFEPIHPAPSWLRPGMEGYPPPDPDAASSAAEREAAYNDWLRSF